MAHQYSSEFLALEGEIAERARAHKANELRIKMDLMMERVGARADEAERRAKERADLAETRARSRR